MPKEYSPFTPGQPVPMEFFVGRVPEINRVRTALAEAAAGRLKVGFLSGERGMGKSSLASFVRYLAERDQQVLGLHTFLGGVTSLEEMVHDFVPALRRLAERLKDEKKAIFLILDDINGLASSEPFANWLKSLVDEIATSREPLPLCLVLVGLEDRRQSLIKQQPSLARVFDIVDIRAWNAGETRTFFPERIHEGGHAGGGVCVGSPGGICRRAPGSGPRDWRCRLPNGPGRPH